MPKAKFILTTALIEVMLCGCGSDNSPDLNVARDALRISPASATLHNGASAQFRAMLNSELTRDVGWTLSGNCNGSQCGTVDSDGLYTAPSASPGKIALSATLANDALKTATAEINVISSYGKLEICPTSATGRYRRSITNCIPAKF